ncbi:GGDEF domain-containing protein [Massilia brevitalea]|uniref:GGDEF domain-containing protein n=1 Tax=Massilia brevitalea TaxID=442526 RepID=UPI00273A53F9|nr:GGDEF domain-containing protein [Massilia brevitalea]
MMPLEQLHKLKPAPFFVIPGLATERGQAIARVCWSLAFAAYLGLSTQYRGTPEYAAAWMLEAAYLVFATSIWLLVRSNFGNDQVRRIAAAMLDQLLCAATLYFTDEVAAPFVLMPLLLTFGSGLRYGRTYAVFFSTLSSTLTCAVLLSSSYWEQFPTIRTGLALATIFFPLYVFRLTDALTLQMRTDAMTGLRNRIGFDELLDEVCYGAAAAKDGSAVILLDLDGFKQINDTQGHDGGDLVLKHIAYRLSVELSPFGVPARIGGDEFAVVVSKLSARQDLEAAFTRFLKQTVEVGRLFESSLGASIGIYYIEPASITSPRFVFKAADQLMYQAKKLGKNRFITSESRAFTSEGELNSHCRVASVR